MLLLEPLWRTILNSSFISVIEELAKSIVITVPLLASPQILMLLLVLVPILVSLGYFGVQARTGFNLHGLGTKPVYLPHRFSEVITFIRKIQDQQNAPFESNMLNTESNLNRE
jgi:hypothetical protein